MSVGQVVLEDHGSIITTLKILWIPAKKHWTHRMDITSVPFQDSLKGNATINQNTWAIHKNIWQLQFFHLYSKVIIHNSENTQYVPKKIK